MNERATPLDIAAIERSGILSQNSEWELRADHHSKSEARFSRSTKSSSSAGVQAGGGTASVSQTQSIMKNTRLTFFRV